MLQPGALESHTPVLAIDLIIPAFCLLSSLLWPTLSLWLRGTSILVRLVMLIL